MQRRVLAAIAAFVLALVGAVLLLSYVSGADDRARASEETVQVLVAQAPISAGTPANQIVAKVDLEDVPARLVAEDAITDLADLGDSPTTGAMLPGDQLSAGRFAERTAIKERDGEEEVSLTLDAQRAVGGALGEGDRVAVYLTRTTDAGSTSERIYDDVEVTRVSGTDDSGAITDPTGGVTVTLALTPEQATTVIAASRDGAVWLSLVTKSEV